MTSSGTKIAVILRGMTRNFGELKEAFLKYLPDTADIFVETYDQLFQDSTTMQVTRETYESVFGERLKYFHTEDIHSATQQVVRHMDLHKLPHIIELPLPNKMKQSTTSTMSQLRKISMALQALLNYEQQHGFNYEIVILTRPDVVLCTNFTLPTQDQLASNMLYCPIGEGFWPDGSRRKGCAKVFGTNIGFNDQIIIGSSQNLRKFIGICDRVPDYSSRRNIILNPETLLGYDAWFNALDFIDQDFVTYELSAGRRPIRIP